MDICLFHDVWESPGKSNGYKNNGHLILVGHGKVISSSISRYQSQSPSNIKAMEFNGKALIIL